MHMQRHLPFVLRNAGSLLALSGGILALCAFFFLPFLSIEIWIAPHPRSTIFSVHNVAVTGAQVASNSLPALPLHPGEGIVSNGYFPLWNAYSVGEEVPLLWLQPLAAVMFIMLAGVLLLVGSNPVMTFWPWLSIRLLIGIALLTCISLLAQYHSDLSWFGVSYSWGFWAVLLGMVLEVLGGGLLWFSHRERRVLTR